MRSSSSCSSHANNSVHLLAEEEARSSCPSATARSKYSNKNNGTSSSSSSNYNPIDSLTNKNYPAAEEEDFPKSKAATDLDLMKKRFATLLLGEDMSGGAKGVSSALAISNAITNLAASVFGGGGGVWRLQPLSAEKQEMWKKEMEWLLAVADHVVEFVPAWQSNPATDHGSNGDQRLLEVMVSRPRSDLQANLPALRKLDAMLVESLEKLGAPNYEFWYADREEEDESSSAGGSDGEYYRQRRRQRQMLRRREEEKRWWLPSTPRVPLAGLSEETVKGVEAQRECIRQILKAAQSINNQALSDMEVPRIYWESLPKEGIEQTGRECLGEKLYKRIASPEFSAEETVEEMVEGMEEEERIWMMVQEAMERAEAAMNVWRRRRRRRHHYRRRNKASTPSNYGSSSESSSSELSSSSSSVDSVLCEDEEDQNQNQNQNHHHRHNNNCYCAAAAAADMMKKKKTKMIAPSCRSRSRHDAMASSSSCSLLLVCDLRLFVLSPPPDILHLLASRAESLLFAIRHRFPSLPPSLLHRSKIHHNQDVGLSILESYSRALQHFASTIISCIDDVLLVNSTTQGSIHPSIAEIKRRNH